jgi:hypothetical protein
MRTNGRTVLVFWTRCFLFIFWLNPWKLYGSKPFPVSSGIVLSTNVTVETTTVAIEVNAKI